MSKRGYYRDPRLGGGAYRTHLEQQAQAQANDSWAKRQSVAVNAGRFGLDDLRIVIAALSQYYGPTARTNELAAALKTRFEKLEDECGAEVEALLNG